MTTFTYSGLELTNLTLDFASGFDVLDATSAGTILGSSSANIFDLTGITSYVGGSEFELQGGADTFFGSNQAESISGGAGKDTLNGGGGDDTLMGGDGEDVLNGGDGADIIHTGLASNEIDVLTVDQAQTP